MQRLVEMVILALTSFRFPYNEITEDPTKLGPNNARNTEISLEGQISSYNNGKNGIE